MEITRKRVFVVGLDGGNFDLIQKYVSEGKLITFKKIIEKGSYGPLESTILPVTPAAWTSFLTGKNPGKHGIFDFTTRKKNTYEKTPIFFGLSNLNTIDKLLSEKNKKTALINVPMTYPPHKLKNGIVISGFPTPEEYEDFVYPNSLLTELYNNLGKFKLQPYDFYSEGNEENFIKCQMDVFTNTKKISNYLLDNYDFDFFMVVFGSIDAFSHAFWRYIDRDHVRYDKKKAKKYGKYILEIYQECDSFIKNIIQRMRPNDILIIMSDHGFGPFEYSVFINNWLHDEGLLKFKKLPKTYIKRFFHQIGFNLANIYKLASKFNLISELTRASFSDEGGNLLSRLIIWGKRELFLSMGDIDWKRTKAYGTGTFGQIFVNLKGREPMGIIESGTEYDKLVGQIKRSLEKLTNPLTGEKMFDRIYKKNEIYKGNYIKMAPDILFFDSSCKHMTSRGFEFGSNKLVTLEVKGWSGTHKIDNGIFFAYGDGVKENFRIKSVRIVDIIPTILEYFGFNIPENIDGKPLRDLLW